MNKHWILFLFLVLIPFIYAEQQIIKTEIIDINIETWIEDNKSFYNVTFNTENQEGDSYFSKQGEGNLSDENFTIRFIREFGENETEQFKIEKFLSECDFNGTNVLCKNAFNQCNTELEIHKNLSQANAIFLPKWESCENEKDLKEQSITELKENNTKTAILLEQEITSKQNAQSWNFWLVIITFVIIQGYHYLKNLSGTPPEETELGHEQKVDPWRGFFDDVKEKVGIKKKKKPETNIEDDIGGG